jgi:predicted transposase YdaD
LKGVIEGAEEKGEAKKAIIIARNMKKNNYDVNEISDMTGLSIDEINDIDLN